MLFLQCSTLISLLNDENQDASLERAKGFWLETPESTVLCTFWDNDFSAATPQDLFASFMKWEYGIYLMVVLH
jgi:hypothetical protein